MLLTWRFITLSLKSALEYRADFFFMVAVGVIWQVTVVAFATVLITRFPGMGGWEPGAVLLITAVRGAGHTLAGSFFMGARQVAELTMEGRIDAFLLRPLGCRCRSGSRPRHRPSARCSISPPSAGGPSGCGVTKASADSVL